MAARLSALERVRIEAMRSAGVRCEDIAERLGRHPSTVWRELGRGRGPEGMYRARRAQAGAEVRARRPRASELQADEGLAARVGRTRSASILPGWAGGCARRRSAGPRTAAAGCEQTRGRTCGGTGGAGVRAPAMPKRPVPWGTGGPSANGLPARRTAASPDTGKAT